MRSANFCLFYSLNILKFQRNIICLLLVFFLDNSWKYFHALVCFLLSFLVVNWKFIFSWYCIAFSLFSARMFFFFLFWKHFRTQLHFKKPATELAHYYWVFLLTEKMIFSFNFWKEKEHLWQLRQNSIEMKYILLWLNTKFNS